MKVTGKTAGYIIRDAEPFGISSDNFFTAGSLSAASLEPQKKELRKRLSQLRSKFRSQE